MDSNLSRRDLLLASGGAYLAAGAAPLASAFMNLGLLPGANSMRCINVVNFIRGVEPRFQTDLLQPVQKQMELILQHGLPATWLLQFDALVSGPFVEFLKTHMAKNHEVGFWFEMNQKHCVAANVEWRGRDGYEWDSQPPVAFTIGYTPEERIKLADAAMRAFKATWGRYPSSVASWNLDSITLSHLTDHYGVDAYAVCRDQIATDGFTIWGAPIAGYFPNKSNCWSPAVSAHNQIHTPIFRMLGQDPVYYYNRRYPVPGGRISTEPDTMEPVWTSGRSHIFVKAFLDMISEAPTLGFGYAQLGQENSFPWPDTADAYPHQMDALAKLRDANAVHVETMGESGRRFKRAFSVTPPQAQVQLTDPFGHSDPTERSIWYQSRFYRADLHLKGNLPFLRDITVYSDRNPQPFLTEATRQHEVEQRMPPVLDGYHWSKDPGSLKEPGAGGFFHSGGQRLQLSGPAQVREVGKSLLVDLPVQNGKHLQVRFDEDQIRFNLTPKDSDLLTVSFEWDPVKTAMVEVQPSRVAYRWQGFDYAVRITDGTAQTSPEGWTVTQEKQEICIKTSQQVASAQ